MQLFLRHLRIVDGLLALRAGVEYLLGRRPRRSTYKKPDPYHPFIERLEVRELPANGILEYAIPTSSSAPRGIAPQSSTSDIVWFVEGGTNQVAKIDSSNNFSEYSIPTSNSNPWDIVAAPSDSAMWFTEAAADQIGRVDYSGNFTEHALTAGSTPHGITLGPDGNLWFTMPGRGYVGKITTGGTITEYNVGGQPENIVTVGSDLFFTDYTGNKIVKITTSGSTTPYTVPTASSQPYGIAAGPDGNVWFTEYATHKIGKMTTSGTFTEYSLTSGSQPRDIAAGLDSTESYLIFTQPGTNKIGRITTGGTVTEWSGLTASSAPEGITERSGGAFLFTENSGNKIGKALYTASGSLLVNDPQQGVFVPQGNLYEVSPLTGTLRLGIPLDLQARTKPDVFGASPSLVFVSNTVSPKPIVQTTFYTADGSAVPTGIDVQLTWNGGSAQSWVSFTTTGHSAGDTYLVGDQVSSAVSSSGLYTWKLEVKATYSGGNVFSRIVTGSTYVIVTGSSSPFGYGWSLAGVDRVTSVTGGMVWESASGGYRIFTGSGPTYTSPANDFGTLVKNGDNTYTYTSKEQFKWDFDTTGKLTKQTDPHGLLRTFLYDAGGRITSVKEPDGSLGTFQYNASNKLEKVTAPGDRVYTITVDANGDLTGAVLPDGSLRTFTYNASHQLTNDKIGLVNTTFAYDTAGTLTTITLDQAQSAHLKIAAQSAVPLNTTPAKNSSDGKGVLTDTLGARTTYLLDAAGRITELRTPDGVTQQWALTPYGLPGLFVDGRGNSTQYAYNQSGDLELVVYPTPALFTFAYDATFHKRTADVDPRSTPLNPIRTTYTYSSTNGDLESVLDPNNKRTTYTWTAGQVSTVKDANANVTTFLYSSRRVETQINPDGTRTTFLYDSAGNATVTIDALGRRTTTQFDGMRRPTQINHPDGSLATFLYNANGLVTDQTDRTGLRTTFAFDQLLRLTSTTRAAGQSIAQSTTHYFDLAGRVTGLQDPRGKLTQFLLDGVGRTTVTIDPLGNRVTVLFDAAGNTTVTIDALGNRTTFLYDSSNRLTVTIDALGNRTTRTYDLASNLVTIQDPNQNTTNFLYDSLGRQTVVIDGLGNRTTSFFDAAGNLTGLWDANGNLTTYVYDSSRRRIATVDALLYRTTVVYGNTGLVDETIDALGNRVTFLYDAAGRQTVVINPLGNRTTTLFDANGNATVVIDARGNRTTFLVDALNRQSVTIDALLNRTTTLFDAAGNVTGIQDPRGKLTQFVFDDAGRQTVTVDPLGNRTTVQLDAAGNVTVSIDARGNRTTFLYDALNRRTVTIDALANRTTSFFDVGGRLTGLKDANGGLTSYLYDAANRRTVVVDPLGNRTTRLIDPVGNVTVVIDANDHRTTYLFDTLNRNYATVDAADYRTTLSFGGTGLVNESYDKRGNITTFLYDAAGQQTVVIDALLNRTTTLFDANGNATVVIDANGNRTTMLFDSLNRATVTIDGRGNRVTSVFDAAGNLTGVQDARGSWTTFAYDDANRRTNTFDAFGNRTTTLYDAAGNATVSIDALGNRTTFLFDALNRQTVTIDALGNRTTQMFDAVGNLTGLKDASNNLTTFAYDLANRKIGETDPLGKRTTNLYDGVGLLTRTTDRLGRRRDFTYTARNELQTEKWYTSGGGEAGILTFSYDASSNLKSEAQSGVGIYTFLYDALDRVTSVNEFGKLLTITYDGVGNRKTFTTEIGTTTYTYDAADNLSRQEFAATGYPTLRVDFTYNAANVIESTTRYSDLSGTTKVAYSTFLYDALGQMTSQFDRKGSDNSVIASYTFLYDAQARLTSQSINGSTTTYGYDNTHQLTQEGTTTFGYDATGNRTDTGYTTGTGNRMTNDGVYTYTYDDEGNLTKKSKSATQETWTFSYDNKNQLIGVEKRASDGGALQMRATYTYDVFGNRVQKEVDSNGDGTTDTNEKFFYDGWKTGNTVFVGMENWDYWCDADSGGTVQTVYVHGNEFDEHVARFGSGSSNIRWLMQDRQNSVRNILDSGGTIVGTLVYDAFGKVTSESAPTESGKFGFQGREPDSETGMDFFRGRYYLVSAHRWLTEDPIDADINPYRFVHNGPTNATDPSGLEGLFGLLGGELPSLPTGPGDLSGWMQRQMDADRALVERRMRIGTVYVGSIPDPVPLRASMPAPPPLRLPMPVPPPMPAPMPSSSNGMVQTSWVTQALNSRLFGWYIDTVDQYYSGWASALTGGLSDQAREYYFGESATRSHEGGFRKFGEAVGTVHLLALQLLGGGALLQNGFNAIHAFQNSGNAYNNFQQGNYFAAGMDALDALGNLLAMRGGGGNGGQIVGFRGPGSYQNVIGPGMAGPRGWSNAPRVNLPRFGTPFGRNARSSTSGNNSAAANGQAAHDEYSDAVNSLPGWQAPYRLPSGKIADAVNEVLRIVRELKPNNPRARRRGQRQAERYAEELERIFGEPFRVIVDVY